MRCFVVAGFLLTSASRGPSAIAEFLVNFAPPSIYKERLELELSNLVRRWAISSLTKQIKNYTQKGRGYGHVTHLIFYFPLKYLRNG